MPSVSIFLTELVDEYRKKNIDNLSKFVQDKLVEQMDKKQQQQKINKTDNRKQIGQALMFMVIGMGFLSMGVAFFQDPTYLYPSIFLIAIGIITSIFGLIGVIENYIKRRVENRVEIQTTLGG